MLDLREVGGVWTRNAVLLQKAKDKPVTLKGEIHQSDLETQKQKRKFGKDLQDHLVHYYPLSY